MEEDACSQNSSRTFSPLQRLYLPVNTLPPLCCLLPGGTPRSRQEYYANSLWKHNIAEADQPNFLQAAEAGVPLVHRSVNQTSHLLYLFFHAEVNLEDDPNL